MNLAQIAFLSWKAMLANVRVERLLLERGARMWMGACTTRVWLTWIAFAEQASRYRRLASKIAASSTMTLQMLVFASWARLMRSTLQMHVQLLGEHLGMRARRWLHKLRHACHAQR